MSRQEEDLKHVLLHKGPRDSAVMTDVLNKVSPSIPRMLVAPGPTINMSPSIRGFQDHMTNWMSSLINQQDGCLQMGARQASQGDQTHCLHAQLAHREAQLECIRSERDIHFVQEEEPAHMRLLSSEAKNWKFRVVSEAEQVLVKECAETTHRATEVQKTLLQTVSSLLETTEAELRDMYESNSTQMQLLAASLLENELEHQQLHTANERRLQLEAQTFRRSQDLEQETLSIAHQREVAIAG